MTLYTETVTGGTAREVYGGLAACDAYLLDEVGAAAEAYRALDSDDDARKRLLISATRYIDDHVWLGTANGAGGTTLAFPRDDLEDDHGLAIGDAAQLARVERAAFKMAAILAQRKNAADDADQGSNVKSMGAGTGRMEFFAPTGADDGTASVLPVAVDRLIGLWLAGQAVDVATVGPIATGSGDASNFDDCDDLERTEPF